ncbi:MAG: stage III sporulation protein AD [Clostridia bacterium]|nr:stage III sporulation protein AD [Clostridia bacterium]
MEIMKIIGVAFVTALSSVLLKATKPELSFAVTVTGIIVILLFMVDSLQSALTAFQAIAQTTGVSNGLLKILLKIVGVGYLTEFGAGILNDFGSSAVADKVVLGGKITIVILSLPILQGLLQLIQGFLQLV